ncbi:MAG: MFS transporter [Gammaproteobacteria bacterium]|nr:MAG: MFS transporter [Gammaproteobacteria bacterium TMED186]
MSNSSLSTTFDQSSFIAAIFYSILATAGLFYVNLGGAFLSAFVDGLGVERDTAGFIVSANKYGAAFGALIATFIVKNVEWRKAVRLLFIGLIVFDLISTQITNPNILILVRFIHGTIGGLSVGIGLSIIARTYNPDKIFGMLLAVQYSFGSIGILAVPRLVDAYGQGALFATLICFTLMTLIILPFIPDVDSNNETSTTKSNFYQIPLSGLLVLSLCCLFLFQAANMGVADYAFELGKDIGLDKNEISNLLTIANFISILGGVLVYIIGIKFGRTIPLCFGICTAAVFTYLLHYSDNVNNYFIANTMTGIAWGFTIPYLLGLCATFDKFGQMAALAGFISKLGLASGPLIGALFIMTQGFSFIINLATIALIIALLFGAYVGMKKEN